MPSMVDKAPICTNDQNPKKMECGREMVKQGPLNNWLWVCPSCDMIRGGTPEKKAA